MRAKTNQEVLAELGRRLRRERLRQDLSQAEVSETAGISERTLRSLEAGSDVQLSTWIRVLRALQRLEDLTLVLPEPTVSPMELLDTHGRERKRASRRDE